jgi:hypothetical protein
MKVTMKVEFTSDEVRAALVDVARKLFGAAPDGMHYEAEAAEYYTVPRMVVESVENEVEKAVESTIAPVEQVTP